MFKIIQKISKIFQKMSKIFQKYFKKFPKFPKISKKNQKKIKKIVRKNVKKIFQKCDAEDFGRQKIILMAKSQFFRFFWGTVYEIQKNFRTKTILLKIY